MIDEFLEKHELSIWTFVTGVAVIFFLMIGGGVASGLLVFSIGSFFAFMTSQNQIILAFMVMAMNVFLLVVANVLIIRGHASALKLNSYNVYIQLFCFLVGAFFFVGNGKWLLITFAMNPLIAYKLMLSDRYKSFVAFYEFIKQDPEGYRKWALGRLSK